MENENKKFKSKYIIYIIAFIIIATYCVIWYCMCNKYRNIIVDKLNTEEYFTYSKVKLTGFPFKYGLNIVEPRIEKKSDLYTTSLTTGSMKLLKTAFSDFITIKIENMDFKSNTGGYTVEFDKKNSIKFKTNDLENFDVVNLIIPELTFKNEKNKDVSINIKNIVYKSEKIDGDDYINTPVFFDIEKITFYNFKVNSIVSNESNLSLSMSSFQEKNKEQDDKVKNNVKDAEDITDIMNQMMAFELDKFTYNSITHNYSINIDGDYSAKEDIFSFLFNIKIKNYDNLISSIKDIRSKNMILYFMNLINIEENNNSDKNILIEKKAEEDAIYINGKNVSELINLLTTLTNGIK